MGQGSKARKREERIAAAQRRARVAVLVAITASLECAYCMQGRRDSDGTQYEPLSFAPALMRKLDAQLVKWLRWRRELVTSGRIPGLEQFPRACGALFRDIDAKQHAINAMIIHEHPEYDYTQTFSVMCLAVSFFLHEHVINCGGIMPLRLFVKTFGTWGEMMIPLESPLNVAANAVYFGIRKSIMMDDCVPDYAAMQQAPIMKYIDEHPESALAKDAMAWLETRRNTPC
jgi:hypothetical protein